MNPYHLGNFIKSGSKELSLSAPVDGKIFNGSRRFLDGLETWPCPYTDFGEPSSQNICSEASIRGLDILGKRGNSEYKSCQESVGRTRTLFLSEDRGRESPMKGSFPQFLLGVNRTIAEPPTTLPVLRTREGQSSKVLTSQSSKPPSVHSQAARSVSSLQSLSILTFRNNIGKLSVPVPSNIHMPGDHKRNFLTFSDGENGTLSDPSKQPKILDLSSPGKVHNSQSQVRKEKFGDRIVALQQLVSPFGKTDTASVLLEAIGYIKFLQDQVQVLSSPYIKPTFSCQKGSGKHPFGDNQLVPDLRSRGLCLVPLSFTSHVASSNGADYWTSSVGSSSCY